MYEKQVASIWLMRKGEKSCKTVPQKMKEERLQALVTFAV